MRTAIRFALVAGLAAGLAACVDESTPVAASATAPHATTTLPENWQVGAGAMRDSQGQSYNVCTLMQTGKGDRRLWIAATPANVSRELYLGVRGPELPDTGGLRLERRAVLLIDGIAYRAGRAQQVGTTLSMSLAATQSDEFLKAFTHGQTLSVGADDLAGLIIKWPLAGSNEAVTVWRDCIKRELSAPAAATPSPEPSPGEAEQGRR
ncbi:hypothetical protein D3874_23245 [Oleomonas cavernae]|uniref:Lipoprotein n=1 Tax=Oleomonas cavernae TaxID=2320859 RepID=A0A418WHP3_9PROT|nr:hypothetical protein [Oleomonas cavernae]RJF89525.1 hypothetical protein D3874_23245 [Oleomonas cavernae]